MILRIPQKIKELPASHEDEADPGSYKQVLFEKNDFDGRHYPQMVNRARIPVGKSFRLHLHEDMQEIFIVTKGRALIRVGDEKKIIKKGDAVLVPDCQVHKMTNVGKSEVEYYVIGLSKCENGKTIVKE